MGAGKGVSAMADAPFDLVYWKRINHHMENQALITVVKNQLAAGVSEKEVKEFLRRRGSDESEIADIFEFVSAESLTIRDIPVVSEQPATSEPVISASGPSASDQMTSEAHGVMRNVPPLQPSVPFDASAKSGQQADVSASPTLPQATNIATESTAVSSVSATPSMPRHKRKIAVIASVVAVSSILIGGFMYAYSLYSADPEKVIDRAVANMIGVDSFAFSGDMVVRTGDSGVVATSSATNSFAAIFATQGSVTISAKLSGSVDATEREHPKSSALIEMTMDKWPFGDFALVAEYRNRDGMNYVKADTVPNFGFLNLDFLKGKWFKADDREVKSQFGLALTDIPVGALLAAPAERRDAVVQAWSEHRFLAVSEVLPAEDIDGVFANHYRLAFDAQAFKDWSAQTGIPIGEALDRMTFDTIEVWIGKRDMLLHKAAIQVSVRSKANQNDVSAVTIVLSANKFNKAMDVTVPEEAQPMEYAIQGIFGQLLGTGARPPGLTTLKERNDQRRKDITAIADAIKKNMTDNGGSFFCSAGPLPQKPTFLGFAWFGMEGYPIVSCLVPKYLSEMPKDPTKGTLGTSGYSAFYDRNIKKITVRAPYAEGGAKISITK